MDISITIETMAGCNWTLWKQLAPQLETLGFSSVFCSDHFSIGTPPMTDALELITALTYLANHTQKVNIGSLVAPLSVRDPVMLARQAMSINTLSGGRMILGVGAGWMQEEHTQFGYNLGNVKTRLDRLQEGLEVITSLVRSKDVVSFQGLYFRLEEARLLPHPAWPTRVLVGGNGPKRTLPLAAKYADIWNSVFKTPVEFRQLSDQLDQLIHAHGRKLEDVKRTIMIPVFCHRTPQELEEMINRVRVIPLLHEVVLNTLNNKKCIAGRPDEVVKQMKLYAEAGVEELIVQWFDFNNFEGLRTISSEVLPHFASV